MWTVLLILGGWTALAVLQALFSNSMLARRWRREMERRDRQEMIDLCREIQAREDESEARRWSKR